MQARACVPRNPPRSYAGLSRPRPPPNGPIHQRSSYPGFCRPVAKAGTWCMRRPSDGLGKRNSGARLSLRDELAAVGSVQIGWLDCLAVHRLRGERSRRSRRARVAIHGLDRHETRPGSSRRASGTNPPAHVGHYSHVEPGKGRRGIRSKTPPPSVCPSAKLRCRGPVSATRPPSHRPNQRGLQSPPLLDLATTPPCPTKQVVQASRSALYGTRHPTRPCLAYLVARCGLPCPCIPLAPFTVLVADLEQRHAFVP